MNRAKKICFGILMLLFFLVGFVEDEPIKELTEKFNSYNEIFPQNKLVLTFNQPEYAPGDTVFFKAYLLNEDLMPIKGRQVASLVLVDEDGNEAIRESFTISNGAAVNQTVLPNDLNGGVYKLVAYTNWMKNFSSKMYFSQILHVASENYFEPKQDQPVKMDLFPEGGNMITGLPIRIVAAATRGDVPATAEGRIVDSKGNELTRFVCDKTGLASFEITLSDQMQYTLEVLPEGVKTRIQVKEEGYSLHVDQEGELLNVLISPQLERVTKEGVYVIATSRSKIRYASVISLSENKSSSVLIPVKNIPEGILQISLFDSKLNELASRLVYVDHQNEPSVSIRLDKESVATRSTISFGVSISDQNGQVKNADVTISGIYCDLFSGIPTADFQEQLLVGSDIPESNYFLNEVDLNIREGLALLDKYLITKEWERFHWSEVLINKRRIPTHRPQDILVYNGIASFRDTGKPVPDSTQVLFFLQKNIFGYEVNTVGDGIVTWPVYFDFYGDENVMYSMESKGKTLANTSIRLLHDSLPGVKAPLVTRSDKQDPYYTFNTIAKVANTAYGYRWNEEAPKIVNANPNAALEDELEGADFSINVDDYVVFPTMEDLFREIVRFVQNRKVGGKQTLRMLSTDSNNPMMGDPLYVVDGIATKNTDFILKMNPGDIATIKVINNVKKLRNLGGITKNGVVFFQTKVANMRSLIPKNDIINIRGLNRPMQFSTTPNQQSERTPYLKSSVYWSAQPQFNENGLISDTFYSADNTGAIKVRVQGITSDGIPFDKEETVQVSFKSN
ncbi:MAG: hypothetical protein KF860_03550 [Cyclobacteriaceae bacterium]|nr:hypothetical protein [Cyclobacteriaceae bacterium]